MDSEALRLYLSEVKNSQTEVEELEEEHVLLNEVEQATDFLQKAGLSELSKIYHQGKEITETVVNESVRARAMTEKQAQTVKYRVRTLNRTLRNRQPRRKQRQDIREVAWNLETSSTGTRSRSATPDSLDSVEVLNEDLTSDEDQQLSLPPFPLDNGNMVLKGKLKITSSEPLPNTKKISRQDRGDVAHLGSENVVLKGYHPISEYGTIRIQRERSGSDPETHYKPVITSPNPEPLVSISNGANMHTVLSRSHNNLLVQKPESIMNNGAVSFEEMVKQKQSNLAETQLLGCTDSDDGVCVDDLTDSQIQYLKPLLWVDVMGIFDQHKIDIVKRKANNKSKKANVFGVKLTTLLMRDMTKPTDNIMVPEIYQIIINQLKDYVKEDGILRVGGQKQKLDFLCDEIENKFYVNKQYIIDILREATVHDMTGVLKKLLRDLPEPIFTTEFFDMFYKCSSIPVLQDKLHALNLLVLMLPVEHRNTFRLLLQFFSSIVENQQYNRMNLHNVAMITAPSFFPQRLLATKNTVNQLEKQVKDAAICYDIMEHLLRAGDRLWLVPKNLAQQALAAQKRAQDRKELNKDKRTRINKKKLQRSNTQYEPSSSALPRVKRNYLI